MAPDYQKALNTFKDFALFLMVTGGCAAAFSGNMSMYAKRAGMPVDTVQLQKTSAAVKGAFVDSKPSYTP